MPQIHFLKNRPSIEVEPGANLMKSLLAAGLPVASSCQGDGVCSKCKIKVIEGRGFLSVETENEKFLREKNMISDEYRISCQTHIHGDITVDATYW